jgi:hypothetical protein
MAEVSQSLPLKICLRILFCFVFSVAAFIKSCVLSTFLGTLGGSKPQLLPIFFASTIVSSSLAAERGSPFSYL